MNKGNTYHNTNIPGSRHSGNTIDQCMGSRTQHNNDMQGRKDIRVTGEQDRIKIRLSNTTCLMSDTGEAGTPSPLLADREKGCCRRSTFQSGPNFSPPLKSPYSSDHLKSPALSTTLKSSNTPLLNSTTLNPLIPANSTIPFCKKSREKYSPVKRVKFIVHEKLMISDDFIMHVKFGIYIYGIKRKGIVSYPRVNPTFLIEPRGSDLSGAFQIQYKYTIFLLQKQIF